MQTSLKMRNSIATVVLFLLHLNVSAQNYNIEQNTDSLHHYLTAKHSKQYPDAKIEILYETGTTDIRLNADPTYEYEIAYKVYDISGLNDFGEIAIPKSSRGTISNLKAITYNLDENGQIAEQQLEKKDVLMEQYSKNMDLVKFSIPGIKDGSVVVYRYTIKNGFRKRKWQFQREAVPVQFSKFSYNASEYALITTSSKTSVPFKSYESLKKFNKNKDQAAQVMETETTNIHGHLNVTYRSWTRRNISPFKSEPFSQDEGQLKENVMVYFNGFSGPGHHYPIVENWEAINKVWYTQQFKDAYAKNNFLEDKVNELKSKQKDTLGLLKDIYKFVQQNYVVNGQESELKRVYTTKQGSSRNINELLCAMYRNAGFQSDIILIANKQSEAINPLLYNIEDITDIATCVVSNGVMYFVDASQKELPFGYLPTNYYNGYTRIVNSLGGAAVELRPELANNTTSTFVSIKPAEESKENYNYKFSIKKTLGIYDAVGYRESWKNDSTLFRKKMMGNPYEVSNSEGLNITNVKFENVDELEERLVLIMEGTLSNSKDIGQILLDPFFSKLFDKNPLGTDSKRDHDIAFTNPTKETYTLSLQLNNQYTIDSHFAPTNFQFGPNGALKYQLDSRFNKDANIYTLKYTYENKATHVPIAENEELRNFYDAIVKSYAQKIIIKKKD